MTAYPGHLQSIAQHRKDPKIVSRRYTPPHRPALTLFMHLEAYPASILLTNLTLLKLLLILLLPTFALPTLMDSPASWIPALLERKRRSAELDTIFPGLMGKQIDLGLPEVGFGIEGRQY